MCDNCNNCAVYKSALCVFCHGGKSQYCLPTATVLVSPKRKCKQEVSLSSPSPQIKVIERKAVKLTQQNKSKQDG